jgi:hypothetical protein
MGGEIGFTYQKLDTTRGSVNPSALESRLEWMRLG